MKKEKGILKKDLVLKTLSFTLKVFFASLILFLNACQDVKKPLPPENLISKDKMASILVDVYTINAARNVNNKLLNNLGVKLDSIIYKKYDIDSIQFVESNNYYSSKLSIYSEIINDAKEQLSQIAKEKDSINKLIEKAKKDTISSKSKTLNKLIDPEKSEIKDSL